MGCSASRAVANEDAVRRCRDRRRHMGSAAASLRRLAAAHSGYLLSLRRAAAAVSRFASLHSFPVSDKTPPVLLSSVVPAAPPPPPPPLFSPPPPPRSSRTLPPALPAPRSPSSAWNWEDFYPPSPPASNLYASSLSSYDGNERGEEEDAEEEEERCSATTGTSSSFERREPSDRGSRGGIWRRDEEEEEEEEASLVVVVRHRDFKEIAAAVEEQFMKAAAAAGEAVAGLLKTGTDRLDRCRTRKTLPRSSRMLSTLSLTGSSRQLLEGRYDMVDGEQGKSHCSTLDRLLSWEKKLYEEVKAREGAKIDYGRKLSTLESQEQKGANAAKLDKMKAAIQQLQSLILETSQAVSTTSSDIIKARDDELAPQLIELCNGFLQMWRSMHQCHEVQNHIVQQVSGLMNHPTAFQSTDLHRQATRELKSAIVAWHSSFISLIKFQKDYIHSLYNWLKLALFQVSNELPEKDHYSSLISSELTAFCGEWKQAVDKPNAIAAEAIHSFANVVHSISSKQKEELKIKKRVEAYAKEFEKKKLALLNTERKYHPSYSMVGVGLGFEDHGQAFDSKDPLIEKKMEVAACRRKVEDEMARHARAIWATREVTLENIQTGLPSLFQEMASFSGVFAEALEDVCCRRIGPWR